jgi:hypothetical protein
MATGDCTPAEVARVITAGLHCGGPQPPPHQGEGQCIERRQ